MIETKPSQPFYQTTLPQILCALALAGAMICLAVYPLLASTWLKTPFIGAFVEHTLLINGVRSTNEQTPWAAHQIGVKAGDRLISVDGEVLASIHDLPRVLSQYRPPENVMLGILTRAGEMKTISVELLSFPASDRLAFQVIPYLLALLFLGTGIWIFWLRRSVPVGRAFAIFCASAALSLGGLFDLYTTSRLVFVWSAAIVLAGGSLFHLAFVYPREDRLSVHIPWLPYVGYIPALGLAAYTFSTLYNLGSPASYIGAWRAEFVFTGLSLVFFTAWIVMRRYRSDSPVEREQTRITLWGALLSFAPLGIWFLANAAQNSLRFSPFLLLPLAIFPLVLGYTIQRNRLLQTDYLLSRALIYGILIALSVAVYVLLVSGLSLVLIGTGASAHPAAIGLMVAILALALNPLRLRLQHSVDALLFKGEAAYQERVQNFSLALTSLVDFNAILKLLQQYVHDAVKPSLLHIFIYNPLAERYMAALDDSDKPTSDLRFAEQSALVQYLNQHQGPVFLGMLEQLPGVLKPEKSRLALLGSQVLIPMPGRQRLMGWLSLGPCRTGEAYSVNDLRFLESLASQSTLALERSQVVSNMENRVREMNVLTRTSQGLNVTLNFDDMLELIYAQTNQVIPTRDFRLLLRDAGSGLFTHAFYLEDDDRKIEMENKPIAPGVGLEQVVTRTGRGMVTDDYLRECQAREVAPNASGIYAWMGVPLNAGAETIGALSLGSRNASINYTSDQLALFQAIADQTAAAIIKTRLLEETERRAQQLSALNELARQLTSTLEIEPLLNNILQSAVSILNCEAGSLLLVDEQTGELVFRVTTGPVAEDLLGKRLPPGTGMVGKSVNTRQPIIQNNVREDSNWNANPDKETGFITRALLVVPLQVKETVIGVIEVINKMNGQPFTVEEQELLTAFAGQAAVAIDNARLYTLTDQALASRVEELSVMQRIDRELNTSLDISRAMRITLEWAMRQSGAHAGLIGVVEGDSSLRVMASQGYVQELAPYQDTPIPASFMNLESVIRNGQPRRLQWDRNESIGNALLEDSRSQLVLPIRREVNTIGLLLLESRQPEPPDDDTLTFLNRLSDHAAIAISNAQLYSAVQSANLAKSEFVSFVSHELKNPMTSIKGYTELLAAGAVGPVNEAQANFLNTIRSNVERMSTLVSDLADVSRIEAGRLKLDFKAVPFPEVLEEVTRSLRRQIDEKSQVLNIAVPENLPLLWVDRNRLNQILTNLISNACKYTPNEGQIYIQAQEAVNQWDPAGAARVIHIWVTDTGIGISPEDQPKIFQKFFRSEDPKTREVPGTGLGLNITRSLVEMQGGKIWFESEYRQGTTFHFTIPVAEA